jgi:PAS domain S-box-containing protein
MMKHHLKLSTKTMVMMGGALAALFVALYAVSTYVVHKGFSQLEENYARRNVDRVLRAIEGQGDKVDISVADWATWDEMYNFVQDRNAIFIQSSLASNACCVLKIHVLLIVDRSGQMVWSEAYDLEAAREKPVPARLVQLAGTESPLTRFRSERDRVSGLVLLDEGPMIVAARPILNSKKEGPVRGALIMGRYLDAAEIQQMANALQLKISAFRADALPDRALLGETLAALSRGEPSKIRVLNTTTLAGYGLVRDLDAKPAVVIEVEMPRDIFAQGLRTSSFFTGMLVLVGALFSVSVMVMLRKQVIARLERLSQDISRISRTQDFSRRVSLPGADELSSLARDINGMLERVVESRRALVKSEERFRIVANYTVDWESWVGINGELVWISPSVERILGYSVDECLAMSDYPMPLIYKEDWSLKYHFLEAIQGSRKDNLEFRFVRKDGAVRWGAVSLQPIFDSQGQYMGHRSGVRDITERKRAEEEIRQLNMTLEQRVRNRTVELERVNEQLSIEIAERKRAEERIRNLNRVQASLFDPGTLQEKTKKITDGMVDVFNADFARIWLVRPGDSCQSGCIHAGVTEGPHVCRDRRRCLHLVSSSGRFTRVDDETYRRVPFGCYKIGRIASGLNSDFLTNDITRDPRVHNHEWTKELGLVSFAGYQLRPPQGETIGVMALFSQHTLSAEEDALLRSFSNLVVLVTQTTQAEEALRESEQRFATTFQRSPVAMVISSIDDGKYLDVNDLFLRDMGYTREEVIGHTSLELGILEDPEDREKLAATMRKQGYIYGQEGNCRTKSGNIISCLVSTSTVSIGGQPCLLSSILNITERKRTETDLLAAKHDAEVANRAKSEFLSRMSHELRTPLHAILGFAQLLEMDKLGEKTDTRVKQILEGGWHLLNLINEVLDLARIEAGRLSLSTEPVSVGELLAETLDLIRPLADKRRIRLEKDLPSLNEWILADRQRLKQVLLNLLNNAIKYNRDEGQVTVGCMLIAECGIWNAELNKDKVAPISESSSPQSAIRRSLRLFIRDTGPGIPAELRPRLFQPFERLVSEKSDMQGTGLGLGLALSKRLVEAMGGTINVESANGLGSTFWVELPIAKRQDEQTARQAEPADQAALINAQDKTVLYVEDNFSNLKLVESIFALCPGVKLLTAMQGRMAMEMAREHQPALILLDLLLPDLDGNEVLRQLKTDLRTRAIPVVILSADVTPRQSARLLEAGARYFLAKPIDVKKFLDMLNDIFRKETPVGEQREFRYE